MSAVSLYRAYRPQTFAEVVGQEHVIAALQQSIRTDRISHAYLFCGTRGTGKTTLAKIFARAINCSHPHETEPCNTCAICKGSLDGSLLDIIEMDAASNNSVDTIRRITDEVVFTPTVARFRVYIIDEVHMLSNGAFNALLKTLEEPPSHAVFILATTDPQRIPATILSRCQRYDLHAMTLEQIQVHLRKIADENNILAQDDALATLAVLAKGAMRDAISLLDQCKVSFTTPFGRREVLELLGQSDDEQTGTWVEQILTSDITSALATLDDLINRGLDVQRLTQGLLQYLRDVLLCRLLTEPQKLLPYPAERIAQQTYLAGLKSVPELQTIIRTFAQLLPQYRQADQPRLLLEIALIQLADLDAAESFIQNSHVKPIKSRPMQHSSQVPDLNPPERKQSDKEPDASPGELNKPQHTAETLTREQEQITPFPQPEKGAPEREKSEPTVTKAAKEPVLAADLWPRAYRKLQTNGGIVLYMLLKNQKIDNIGDRLLFHFAANQQPTYNEFCKEIHQKKLMETLTGENRGCPVTIEISFAGTETASTQEKHEHTIEQLRNFAEKYQVKFEMEEEYNG